MLTIPVESEWIDQLDIIWEVGAKNWIASVFWDPDSPGNLGRTFWKSGRGDSESARQVPEELAVGDFIEVASDDKIKGVRGRHRLYFRVATCLADKLQLVKCQKPHMGDSSVQEFIAEIEGRVPGELDKFEDEDLIIELRRRGYHVEGDE